MKKSSRRSTHCWMALRRRADEQVAIWRRLLGQYGIPMFQAAHDALLEYGCLKVIQEGIPKGVDESRCLLDLNPELLLREVWRVGSTELVLGYALYPLGKVDREGVSLYLYID